jgi:glycosyltransferase involved in cell wall biosynthesis
VKILLINNIHYRKGGSETVYFNTARLLEQYGHEVAFFSTSNPDNIPYEHSEYFAVYNDYRRLSLVGKMKAMPAFIYNREAFRKLLKLVDEFKPDVAHLHLFFGGLSTSILQALNRRNVPVVISVHDYRLICPAYLFIDGKNRICEKCKDRFYLRCIIKKCSGKKVLQSAMLSFDAYFRKYFVKPLNYIDCFIFVSRFTKYKHIEFNSAYKSKAVALFNFIPDLNLFKNIEVKGEYLLYYGRLSREKGLETLVEVASSLKMKLKIAGTGPLYEYYRNKIYRNIEFLGYKSGEDLWNLVRNSSFIIVPSECYENNPLTILEAYANGKPVIGARIGGIPEIIEHGNTGFLFEPGDKKQLQAILYEADQLDKGQYEQMSKNARSFANNNFSPDIHYQKLIETYKKVIKQV